MRYAAVALAALISLAACSEQAATAPKADVAPPAGVATEATKAANAALAERLPLDQPGDFEDAGHGLLAQIQKDIVDETDKVVWAVHAQDFINGAAPDTVNPSLWRQQQLLAKHGLFEVKDGLYQVRGYDLAVMSIIRGETGWIIVDPLTSKETAAAALKLVNDTLVALSTPIRMQTILRAPGV